MESGCVGLSIAVNLLCNCREVLAVRDFGEPNYIQCITFDPKGCFIGIYDN